MAAPRIPSPARIRLALLLLVPVLIGSAAALLLGSAPTPGSVPTSAPTVGAQTPYRTVAQIFLVVLVGGLAAWIVIRILQAVGSKDTSSQLGRGMAFILFLLIVGIALVLVLRVIGGAGLLPGGAAGPPANRTAPANGTGTSPIGGPTGNAPVAFPFPGWLLFVGIAVVAVVAGVLVVPWLAGRSATPPPVPPAEDVRRRAVTEAIAGLEDDRLDPRARIVLVYRRLLDRIAPRLAGIESMTPREIAGICHDRLGVSPPTARELTSLFEEARYSHHEIGVAMVERARRALASALSDLDRVRGVRAG